MKSIKDIDVKDKRVLLRADFNVPLDKEGNVTDDFRIVATLATIKHLLSLRAKVILMSHLGHPDGKVVEALKMQNVRLKLQEHLNIPVISPKDNWKDIVAQTHKMRSGEVLLLENLRFFKGEEENDKNFAQQLSRLGDIYINDAFGVCHRSHASVVGVPKLLDSAAGLLLEKEVQELKKLLLDIKHPMVAIIGGRKIEDKLPLIDNISDIADIVLLGNLLSAQIEKKGITLKNSDKVFFPLDGLPGNGIELDIGPKTIELYKQKIQGARTIVWAGPLGKYEEEEYAKGSFALASAIVEQESFAVAGGGNTMDFLGRYNLREKFDHISTGGNSMLAFLAGKTLPGLEVLGYYGN